KEDVNAKYISKNGFKIIGQMSSYISDPDNPGQDIQFIFDQIDPIDIKNYNEIRFVLDSKGEITVNLKAEITLGRFNETIFANDSYWIYLSNYPNPYDSPQWTGTSQDARYRKGIVQLINEHMILLTETQPGEYDFYDAYQDNKSYQYLNVSLNDDLAYLLDFFNNMSTGYELDKIISINDNIYKFKFTHDIYDQAHAYFYNTNTEQRYAKLRNAQYEDMNVNGTLEKTAIGVTMVIDYLLFAPNIGTPSSWEYLQKWDFVNNKWVDLPEGIPGVRCDCVMLRQFSTDYEYLLNNNIGSVANTNENYLTWDICFYTYDYTGFANNTHYIRIMDSNLNGEESLLFSIKNLTNTQTLELPEPLVAADYNNVASIYDKEFIEGNVLTKYQYLQIISPTVGEQSSIYFNKADNVYDFMNYYMGISYENRLSKDSINYYSSDKAYGIKKTTLIINNVVNSRYGNGEIYNNVINIGNIIYEHNNINNNVDLPEIFASYKINSRNEIVIGSVFNNFVFTGDSNLDSQYKPPISGVNGQYIIKTDDSKNPYRINEGQSNFQIKFTQQPVNNNSIELINSDIGAYEVSQVHLETKTITNFNNIGIPKLIFSIDDFVDYKIEIDLSPFSNGAVTSSSDIFNIIYNKMYAYSALTNSYKDIFENKDIILTKSYKNKNVFVISNLLKRESSNITFYFDEDKNDEDATFVLFKMIFGTEQTNPEFYELYDGIISDDNKRKNVVTTDGDNSTGTVFAPLRDKPITFTYRVKKSDGSVSNADYYYTVDDYIQQDNSIKQRIILHKTFGSTFQDLPFYTHFVNNRTYETDQYGDLVEIEEDRYQFNIKRHKISGMDVHFAIPYFKTFDIHANIIYNRNYSYNEIWERIDETLRTNYDIKNMKISKSISKSKIFKDIMNIIGVTSCDITYFGFDYTD
ncbi:MAG: hypothetical protein LBF97_04115, partial [Elusimicrobiota bacterium]|nr:hypothetical protein [Elusimicrobiota bacterium]